MTKGSTIEHHQYENDSIHYAQTLYWCFCIPISSRHTTRRHHNLQSHQYGNNTIGSPYHNVNISHVMLRTYPTVEHRTGPSRSMLQQNGQPSKILLFPEEGWARSASSSYWMLTPYWWHRGRCKVVEVAGTRRFSTKARLVDNGAGALYVLGSFKRMSSDCDFKLFLTSNVSSTDFNMGYCMTGTLERGSKKTNTFQMTHFAVIRRNDYETSKL